MENFIETFFNLDIMGQALPLLLRGALMTLELCAVVIALGLAGGLTLAVLAGTKSRVVRWATLAFIDVFRALRRDPDAALCCCGAGFPAQ